MVLNHFQASLTDNPTLVKNQSTGDHCWSKEYVKL